MRDLCRLIGWMVVDLIRSRVMLEAEIWTLRQQINVLRRTAPNKLSFCAVDRMIFVGLYRLVPKICDALAIVKPDTLVRWHRAGFRSYWRWKSRRRGGRPIVPVEIRRLIREMSIANPLWGAPRIHGELLKLGIDIGQTSVAKYMARRRGPPSKVGKHFSIIMPTASQRWIMLSYMKYYNEVRTHLSLEKDTPVSRAVERTGHILCRPVLGGLHHQYIRI